MKDSYQNIKKLYKEVFDSEPDTIVRLAPSGSNRQYFRITEKNRSVIAAYNADKAENDAFFYITRKLKDAGVNVPGVLATDTHENIYLLEDLGDIDLFKIVVENHHNATENYLLWYKKVIKDMPSIQYKVAKDFDFSICYPRSAFDKQSMLWDLNYFKYHFLKLAYTPFHEQKLEDDFQTLADFLMEAPSDFFLFRDFQSRNIMIHDNKNYYIDYQGGRKGALQYDLASLLFEAKTALNPEHREILLNHYLEVFSEYSFFDRKIFLHYFPGFVLVRSLQAFGAYGYRGYFERKPHFLQSIPPAITNLRWLLNNFDLNVKLPHLRDTLLSMVEKPAFQVSELIGEKLTVTIYSFSYRKGIPDDFSGNGGGFVFDCRALPNPGKLEEFQVYNGKDQVVKDFFLDKPEVENFMKSIKKIVFTSVDNYIHREFEHLMVSFGCTGGQHRSVYCAEEMGAALKQKYNLNLKIIHKEMDMHHD